MKRTDLPLRTQPQPSPIGRPNVLKVEPLRLAHRSFLPAAIGDLGVEVAHLRILLNVEAVLHVAADGQARLLVHRDHSVSLRAFKNMQFNQSLFGGGYDSEFAKAHLKHHVFFQESLAADHDECACGRAYISEEEFR